MRSKMKQKKKLDNQLIVAIDFGGSMTKVIGGTSHQRRKIIAIEPTVIEIPKQYLEKVAEFNNQNQLWLVWDKKYYAVGMFAKTLSIENPRLTQQKTKTAIQKTLAAIYLLKKELNLSSQFYVDLSCVLPEEEESQKNWLETQLRKALSSFDTPAGTLNAELRNFMCRPEGAGIYINHSNKRGREIQGRTLAVLMMGYRNTSLILVSKGHLVKKATCKLGFSYFLESIITQTNGYSLEVLTCAVANYLETGQERSLRRILLDNEPEKELLELKEAIATSIEKFLTELKDWVDEQVPKPYRLEEIVFSGGTSDTLSGDLKRLWKNLDIYLHGGVILPKDIEAINAGNRFADIWIMWSYFNKVLNQQVS